MFSYRFHDDVDGGQSRWQLTASSPDTIVTTDPESLFRHVPGQPPTLRVVPTGHGYGHAHARHDVCALRPRHRSCSWAITCSKEMSHVTYMGGMGTTVLGEFTTKTSGWGDTNGIGT